jgi:hypothetical protein
MLIWKNYYSVLSDFKIQNLDCTLLYIPEHLHFKGKPIINTFSIGEKLYYRCLPQNLQKPYDSINLKDISHNRNFCNDTLFGEECVKFNIDPLNEFEKYETYNVVTLLITNLDNNQTYSKSFTRTNHEQKLHNVLIYLKHDPIACMYPHSVFEIKLDGVVVTSENYKETIGKGNKFFSNIRSEIRQELTLLIQNGIVDSSLETEYINEP